MTVVKVRKRIRLRGPSGMVGGMAKAMASETTPRIPAHEVTIAPRQVGFSSRSLTRADSSRGRKVAG